MTENQQQNIDKIPESKAVRWAWAFICLSPALLQFINNFIISYLLSFIEFDFGDDGTVVGGGCPRVVTADNINVFANPDMVKM